MARALSSQKVFHQLSALYRLDDNVLAATDVTVGALKGSLTTITVASAAGIVTGDYIRVGANGDTAEVQKVTVATNDITPDLPWSRDIVAADASDVVQLLDAIDLGATDENGINLETAMGETPIVAGTQKNTYLYINQAVEEQFSFAMRDFEAENIAMTLGLDESDTGIVSANGVVIIPDEFGSKGYCPWMAEGLLEDASPVTALIYSAKVVAPNQTLNLTEGQATILACSMRSNGNRAFLIG
jgi:hypothetical protein